MASDVTSRLGGIMRSMRFCSRLCYSSLVPLLPTSRRLMAMEDERLSGPTAGGPCMSFRAHPHNSRISPRSARYPGHLTHAFVSPTFVPVRLQVVFPFSCTSGASTAAVASPEAHVGRFGCDGLQVLGAAGSGGSGSVFASAREPTEWRRDIAMLQHA